MNRRIIKEHFVIPFFTTGFSFLVISSLLLMLATWLGYDTDKFWPIHSRVLLTVYLFSMFGSQHVYNTYEQLKLQDGFQLTAKQLYGGLAAISTCFILFFYWLFRYSKTTEYNFGFAVLWFVILSFSLWNHIRMKTRLKNKKTSRA